MKSVHLVLWTYAFILLFTFCAMAETTGHQKAVVAIASSDSDSSTHMVNTDTANSKDTDTNTEMSIDTADTDSADANKKQAAEAHIAIKPQKQNSGLSGHTVMHPPVEPLNKDRQNAFYTQTPVDANATCGHCHDTTYIGLNNTHQRHGVNATCFDCHVSEPNSWSEKSLDSHGQLNSAASGIRRVNNAVCAKCHGIVENQSLEAPVDYESRVRDNNDQLTYDLTRYSGAFFSGVPFSRSNLNLHDKAALNFPADVHAQRMLSCADCHYSTNNPMKAELKKNQQRHLRKDPRGVSLSKYLERPNHRLHKPVCTECHRPSEAHDFLPYKDRHLDILDCQSCHVAKVYGPMVTAIDETVMTRDGAPILEYAAQGIAGNLNAAINPGVSPALIPYIEKQGDVRVGAFNLVTHWFWQDGATQKRIPTSALRDFYLQSPKKYTATAISLFDTDKNGRISREELIISSEKQRAAIERWLTSKGFTKPEIVGVVDAHIISHGMTEKAGVVRECESCHGKDGRLAQNVNISRRIPMGAKFSPGKSTKQLTHGTLSAEKSVRWIRSETSADYYVFGFTRASWSDLFGLLLFGSALLGLLIHGGYRFYSRKNRTLAHGPTKRVYMYSLYERLWHWLMAISVIVLLITGLKIHFSLELTFMSFPIAVTLHNLTAIILVVNAGLSLFFHLASTTIMQFIPEKKGLPQALLKQIDYYTRGIFLGHKHPTEKTPEKKLNPLQQLTYLGLLNVLFPLQVITGIAIWLNSRRPDLLEPLGGLTTIGPIHNLGSWLFLTFLMVHLYLTTTGHTLVSNICAMIDGYDDIDADASQGGNE